MSSILHSGLWRPDILKSQPWTPAVQKKKIDFDPDEVSPFWSTPEGIQILTSLLKKYSEDQPRDSHGRFASGESGDTKDKELAPHLSYISNAVESFRAAGGEVKLLDPGFDTDELEKMASNLTSTMDKIYDSYTSKLMTSSEVTQVDKLTTALNAMRAAVTDTLSGITENVFVAYDKNGSPVAALSFNEPMGESLSIGYLGSTLTVAGAGTALQYELAQYAANEHVGVDSVSGMGSQNYHELIGRTVDNAGNSTWTDEQVQQIADLNLPSLQKLFKYDEDQQRDSHGRWTSDGSTGAHIEDLHGQSFLNNFSSTAATNRAKDVASGKLKVVSEVHEGHTSHLETSLGTLHVTRLGKEQWTGYWEPKGTPKESGTGRVVYQGVGKSGLTAKEQAALSGYKGGAFAEINGTLRGKSLSFETDESKKQTQEKIAQIDKMMQRSQLTEKIQVYRGFRSGVLPQNLKVGDTFVDKAFTSTSLSAKVASGFGANVLSITLPAGTRAIEYAGGKLKNEQEFLVDRNTTYRVTSINSYGTISVVAEQS